MAYQVIVNQVYSGIANANPIDGIFTALANDTAVQVLTGVAQGVTVSTNARVVDTTNSYNANSFTSITIGGTPSGGGGWYIIVRCTSPTGLYNKAEFNVQQGTLTCYFRIQTGGSGGSTVVSQTGTLNSLLVANDVYTLEVSGQTYTCRQNGVAVLTYKDGSSYLTGGISGFGLANTSILTQTQVAVFQSGNVTPSLLQVVNNSTLSSVSSLGVNITCSGGSYFDVLVYFAGASITSVTDGTNTYHLLQNFQDAALHGFHHYWTGPVTAGTYTVTANFGSSNTYNGIVVAEIGGTSGIIAYMGQAQATPGTGTDGVTTGLSVGLASSNALVWALACSTTDGSSNTAGTNYTGQGYLLTNIGATFCTGETQLLTSGAPIAATWQAANNNTRMSMAGVWMQTGAVMQASKALTTAGNSAATTALPIATRTGDTAVAFVQTLSAQPLSGFTDVAGNIWSGIASPSFDVTINSVHYYLYVLYSQNITGHASEIYTASISNGPIYISINVMLFPGRMTSGTVFDGSTGTASDSITPQSHPGPSVTTSYNNSYAAMMAWDASTSTDSFTPTAGFTLAAQNLGSGSSYFPSFSQYKLVTVAGGTTAAFTTGNSVNAGSMILALLAFGSVANQFPIGQIAT